MVFQKGNKFGCKPCSEYTKQRLRECRTGNSLTEEAKRKSSISHKENARINSNYGMKGKKQSINSIELSKARVGWKHTPEAIEKIRIKSTGRHHNEDTRKRQRLNTIKYIKENCGGISPRVGRNEKSILNGLETFYQYEILRQYETSKGYFIDGYIPEMNLAIEIDEPKHNNKIKIEKDIQRQSEIEQELNCKFIRIKSE